MTDQFAYDEDYLVVADDSGTSPTTFRRVPVSNLSATLVATGSPRKVNALDRRFGIRAKLEAGQDVSAELMAMFALADTNTPYHFYLPAGDYVTSQPVVVPFIPRSVVSGDGPMVTRVTPDNGVGGFRFGYGGTHGMTFRDLSVEWDAVQTDTDAIGFSYNPVGGGAAGWFSHRYENIVVNQAYRGWSLDESIGAQQDIWGSSWEGVRLYDTKNSGFYFVSAVSAGKPELSFAHVFVENTGVGAPQSTGDAFAFQASEVSMDNVGVEGWYDKALSVTSGGHCVAKNFHVESHVFDANESYCLYVTASSFLSVDGLSIAGASTAGVGSQLTVCKVAQDAAATFRNVSLNVDATLGAASIKEFVWANAVTNEAVTIENIISTGANTIPLPFTGSRATQNDATLVQIGKLAGPARTGVATPLLRLGGTGESLPTASSALHGLLWLVKGGGGVADTLSVCLKAAGGTYSWITVATG